LKQKLQYIDVRDAEELKSEILTTFQGIPSDGLKKSFDQWIERYEWTATNAGDYHPS
jgi:rhodanese-related sulfurtransferase